MAGSRLGAPQQPDYALPRIATASCDRRVQRDAGAENDPGQDVTTEFVRTEPVESGLVVTSLYVPFREFGSTEPHGLVISVGQLRTLQVGQ